MNNVQCPMCDELIEGDFIWVNGRIPVHEKCYDPEDERIKEIT